ncbi:MAG: hypothetical protein B6245_19805 [Desulfobacteraceae bacterium 4572_88]|nr:MAG: hypothetical protein B6245_19805 [Desulfobacteraceae bacterium 4572_88]RLC03441.1 MAG: hypothetical protein DRI57_29120 [Deltaproteobacteria bacterium]
MITANAFGFERLNRIFIAAYQMRDAEATAFISKRETGQEAAELVSAFREFLITYGGQELQPDRGSQMSAELRSWICLKSSFTEYPISVILTAGARRSRSLRTGTRPLSGRGS